MIDGLWEMFPRLMERNINGLLDEAGPNALRKLQIYRALKGSGHTRASVEEFLKSIEEFFSRPRSERQKSQFDRLLERPMDHATYALFQLDFRTAVVPDESLYDLANWAHNLIRVAKKTSGSYMSQDVLLKALHRVTNPTRQEKAVDIQFSDFCAAWKRTVSNLFGAMPDPAFESLIRELERLAEELKRVEAREIETALVPGVFLKPTEIDWLILVRRAADLNADLPAYPEPTQSANQELKELNRVLALYKAARTSHHPELVRNRERIRATVLDRCDHLLGEEKKLVG